jgi:two-component system LytT family response regulator
LRLMIKAIIVDDEKRARETIRSLVELYCKNTTVVAEAENITQAEEAITKHHPDLIFLDISMPGGNGFELLKKYTTLSFKVIFITAHNEFAVKAFKYSALDYLLKPINPDELIAAVDKAESLIEKENLNQRLEIFMSNMESKHTDVKKIVLKTSESIHIINVNDIIRCEADRNYSSFFLTNKKPILVSTTLKDYDELLSSFHFFRVHQSHLVNLNHIERYEKKEGGCLIMKDGSTVPVSVRKKEELLILLQNI